jgi:hemerythrin-like domain-containing protein
MKSSTQAIYEEHGIIMLFLKILRFVSIRLRTGKRVEKKHLQQIVKYLQVFAERLHHAKEEILLSKLPKNVTNKIVMSDILGDHLTDKDFIGGIEASIKNYRAGNMHAIHIAQNLEIYANHVTEHVRKENSIFLPAVEKSIVKKEHEKILKLFTTLEVDIMGKSGKEKFFKFLDKLKTTYLN